ncbi:MAG TPA: Uma2 family endonuclease [Roseiarcus sp.]|nr:Uma2 family endonuclease [Roseiarcus sp.]
MAEPVLRNWTVEEFFAWQETQPDRYELVDGRPLKMMAGAKNVHDDIVVNLIAELRAQLRGGGRRPFTGDGAVETRPGQIRRPDVGVDCGRRDPNATTAALPKLLIEVLSPSTRDFDSFAKLEEYKRMASVDYVGLIEPNEPLAYFWRRNAQGSWVEERVRGLDGAIEAPGLAVALQMAAIYEGVEFTPVGLGLAVENERSREG